MTTISMRDIIVDMNAKHRRTYALLHARPGVRSLAFRDVEALLRALGCSVCEGEGSRVNFRLGEYRLDAHRPHPGKEIKPYQIRDVREFLEKAGVGL